MKDKSLLFGRFPCFLPKKARIPKGRSGHCARLSQRYSSGVLVSQHDQLGAIPPPSQPFPLGEHSKWRCDAPSTRGYLSDTCAIPHEDKAKWVAIPPLRYYLERVLRNMGEYLTLGPLRVALVPGLGGDQKSDVSKSEFWRTCFLHPGLIFLVGEIAH